MRIGDCSGASRTARAEAGNKISTSIKDFIAGRRRRIGARSGGSRTLAALAPTRTSVVSRVVAMVRIPLGAFPRL
eukprot:7129873-Heterocapsa_arctica.AAC.1